MDHYQGTFSEFYDRCEEFYERIINPHDAVMENGRGILDLHVFLARMRAEGGPLCERMETYIQTKFEFLRTD